MFDFDKYDPNAKKLIGSGIFGLPLKEEDAKVVYIPVPWDVTTSYLPGTSEGPSSILRASEQIDLFDLEYVEPYRQGLFMQKENPWIRKTNKVLRKKAEVIIDAEEKVIAKSKEMQKLLKEINAGSEKLNQLLEAECTRLLELGKIPVLVGGDHSIPYGSVKAYAKKYKSFGLLHFDAHSDNRIAYEGFKHSHASIIYNISQEIPEVKSITQVGIRDFCDHEYNYTRQKKYKVFFDLKMKERRLKGESFYGIAKEIVATLPQKIYITFDIDGLDPKYCPNTGTPVQGGLDLYEVIMVLKEIVKSGKEIVGFDLVEVKPSPVKGDEWNENVGMRILYKLTGACLASQKLIKWNE